MNILPLVLVELRIGSTKETQTVLTGATTPLLLLHGIYGKGSPASPSSHR